MERKDIMIFIRVFAILAVSLLTLIGISSTAIAQQQPVAIFHAFNQPFSDVEDFVCTLAEQGYSHLQISPAQKSHQPDDKWFFRYQPFDYSVIEGLGDEGDLKRLIDKAHSCNVQVITDVVFNHMANVDDGDQFEDLTKYPGLTPEDFHTKPGTDNEKKCDINYDDGNRFTEVNCWLGGLPDLDVARSNVQSLQKAHLEKLLSLGVDGFRFDAAKHIPASVLQDYINFINQKSGNQTWNYLEVITDSDTRASDYNHIAAVTDFILYNSMKNAFSFGGDLRSLRPPQTVPDPRSVTFGQNHDTIREPQPGVPNSTPINPYDDVTDSYLATAYVLARHDGTPLVFGPDNIESPFIPTGVKFRQIMKQRGADGRNVTENILAVVDSPTLLVMERGKEGFAVINKAKEQFDVDTLDMTLSNLEGCYRELRNDFTVAIEQREGGRKFVTRWGTNDRGGMEVQGRDALFFIREPFEQCRS
jgi:alpha-amylase